jgi:hypothetical protein
MTARDDTPAEGSLDALAKAVARGLVSRRQALRTLGAGLVGGLLGGVGVSDAAEGMTPRRIRQRSSSAPPPGQPPDASQRCLAAGDVCGTIAGSRGQCRLPAVADNLAGFVCTSDEAGKACAASTRCCPGTRCVVSLGSAAQTCRGVIA